MEIHEFDVVRLKDGREVVVMESFNGGEAYYVEFSGPPGGDCELFEITPSEIVEVTYRSSYGEG